VLHEGQDRRLAHVGVRVFQGPGERRDGEPGLRGGQRGRGAGADLPGGVGLGGGRRARPGMTSSR
jgi:hypothetical protein